MCPRMAASLERTSLETVTRMSPKASAADYCDREANSFTAPLHRKFQVLQSLMRVIYLAFVEPIPQEQPSDTVKLGQGSGKLAVVLPALRQGTAMGKVELLHQRHR